VNQHALYLGVELEARLASLGPGARGMSVHRFLTFTLVQIIAATDGVLQNIIADLGLNAPQQETAEEWWQWLSRSEKAGLHVVVTGPRHPGPPLGTAGKA
jgi:hypothetical protein